MNLFLVAKFVIASKDLLNTANMCKYIFKKQSYNTKTRICQAGSSDGIENGRINIRKIQSNLGAVQ